VEEAALQRRVKPPKMNSGFSRLTQHKRPDQRNTHAKSPSHPLHPPPQTPRRMGRTPLHPPRHRTRPNPLQALRRQRPLRPRLARPERATATEGTTTATSSASRACPEERQRRMGQMHPPAPREKFLPLRNRPQRHPLHPRPNRLLRHRSLSRAKPRDKSPPKSSTSSP
jgi:hypothetical protein